MEKPKKKENIECFKQGGSIREFRRGFNAAHKKWEEWLAYIAGTEMGKAISKSKPLPTKEELKKILSKGWWNLSKEVIETQAQAIHKRINK